MFSEFFSSPVIFSWQIDIVSLDKPCIRRNLLWIMTIILCVISYSVIIWAIGTSMTEWQPQIIEYSSFCFYQTYRKANISRWRWVLPSSRTSNPLTWILHANSQRSSILDEQGFLLVIRRQTIWYLVVLKTRRSCIIFFISNLVLTRVLEIWILLWF